MKNSPYACSLCRRRFGRRWNALRHNFTHFNQGEIYDRFDNLVQNLPLPQSKTLILDNNGIERGSKAGVKESNRNYNHDQMLGIPSIKNAIKGKAKSEDDIYNEGIEKLVPLMSELDGVLSDYPKKERECIRNMVIMLCVSSVDPISNLKEILSFIKNNKLSNEIRDCISSLCNIPPPMASVILRNSILVKHKRNVWTEKTDSGFGLQQLQRQQQQQKLRSPPYFIPSLKKLKPYGQKIP